MNRHAHVNALLAFAQGQANVLATGFAEQTAMRRAVSSAYYVLFHFLVAEISTRLVGEAPALSRRRHALERVLTHAGLKLALDKVRGREADSGIADLLRPAGTGVAAVIVPDFARNMAANFADLQAERHDADRDWNTTFAMIDALLRCDSVADAIAAWESADTPVDRDVKHALALLMLLRGRLRAD